MKTWQVLALCFSIIISVAASAFYLKYEPKTIIKTDTGTFDLGKVFAEMVSIDIVWVDLSGNEQPFVSEANFYNSSQSIARALVDLNNERNATVAEHKKTTYDKINGFDAGKVKLKIRTYITYYSSNYTNTPYYGLIGEETHNIQGYTPLKESVYSITDKSFKANREKVEKNLFLIDKDDFIAKQP